MGNCLVTKLNAVVNNNNILKIGEMMVNIRGNFAHGDNNAFYFSKQITPTYRCIYGDATFTLNDIGYAYQLFVEVQNASKIAIGSKYNLTTIIDGPRFDIYTEDIGYAGMLTRIESCALIGSLHNLSNLQLMQLKVYDCTSLTGRISDLTNSYNTLISLVLGSLSDYQGIPISTTDLLLFSNLDYFATITNNPLVSGNINILGSLTKLSYFDSRNNSLTGSIEGLVESMCSNNRQSGDLTIMIGGTDVKFNNSKEYSSFVIHFNNNGSIVNDSSDSLNLATYTKSSGTWV